MKLFGTDGIRAVAGEYPLTRTGVRAVGRAAGETLRRHAGSTRPTMIVGQDTRESCAWIQKELASGLALAGVQVKNCGVIPTSAVAALLKRGGFLGGAVISASHNPPEFNGIKFFAPNGKKIPDAWEREIEDRIAKLKGRQVPVGKARTEPYPEAAALYMDFLKGTLPSWFSLKGLRWVVDCANGSASAFAPELLRELGAEVFVLHASPNGLNINKDCGALHTQQLQKEVVKRRADGGCAFDGDADRVQFVDEKGRLMDGDVLIGMAAQHLLELGELRRRTVVTTVMANLGFMKAMRALGVKVEVTPVGDKAVSDALEKTGAVLGGEQSGHIIFHDHLPTGDGLLTALHILNVARSGGKKLSHFKKKFPKFPQILINLRVKEKVPVEKVPDLHKRILGWEKRLNGDGRVLVRYSGTEPLLRVMVEGSSLPAIRKIAGDIVNVARERLA